MPARSQLLRQFFAFGAVGVAGFGVDAGVLTLLLRSGIAGPYLGRVVSFLCAASCTWILNKTYTFADRGNRDGLASQWLRFLGANAVGGLVNYGVYSLLLSQSAFFSTYPVAAVAVGSLSGLTVNFALSRTFVFAGARPSGAAGQDAAR